MEAQDINMQEVDPRWANYVATVNGEQQWLKAESQTFTSVEGDVDVKETFVLYTEAEFISKLANDSTFNQRWGSNS